MTEVNFKFISDASAGDEFSVVSFSGNEAISRLYRYKLEIRAPRSASINLDDVLNSPARFITSLDGEEFPVHGVLSSIDELQTVHGYVHYQVVMVPRLWWLSIYKTNEIYTMEKTIDQIIQLVLENAGFNSDIDFDLSALNTGNLIQRDYRCQFGESDFDFISRLMENEGIFYYFDQSGDAEKIVFVNDMSYLRIVQPELIFDVSTQTRQLHDSINAWSCRKQRLPANVTVRDYNPDHPSLDISGTASVDTMGIGTDYQYGENVGDENEAEVISEIRAEERLCNKTRYYGESSVPRLQAGFVFNLDMHPNEDYNGGEYLTLEVNHSGQNLDMSMSGESQQSSPSTPQYHNNFVAIEASEQYRPDRITPKPRFFGTMTAFVYAEAGNNLAEIDEFGRYRVHLPFDRADGTKESTDPDRKASTWIRKAQDYVGEGKGSYFPLTGGTEVLLSFINGDPDQPIIVGAVPNASEPSLLTTDNEFESRIQTGSGNKIRMGDVEGQDRIVMESPMANSWLRIGTTNDPITLQGESPQFVEVGSGPYSDPDAYSTDTTVNPATNSAPFSATEIKNKTGTVVTSIDTTTPGEYVLKYEDSNNTNDTALRKVVVGEAVSNLLGGPTDGVRIRSAGNYWQESKSRYGEYHAGKPAFGPCKNPANASDPSQIGDMLDKFGTDYNPTGLLNYADHDGTKSAYQEDGTTLSADARNVAQTIANAHVHVSSLDTFNTQEGNVYDFGGYWVYNLGNGYVENHIEQNAELNKQHKKPLSGPGAAPVVGAVAANLLTFIPTVIPAITGTLAAVQGGAGGVLATSIIAGIGIPIISIGASVIGYPIKLAVPPDDIGDVIKGPNSGPIATWINKVNMDTGSAWVEKKFGDSYNYTVGNEIDITHGNSEIHRTGDIHEYKYGGAREFTSFSKGTLSHWEKSFSGQKAEANWDKASGQILNFSYNFKGFFNFSVTTTTMPRVDIALAMSSIDAKAKISLGTAFNFNVAAAIGMNINLVAGLYVNYERKVGGELKFNEVTNEFEFKAFGMAAGKKAALDAKKKSLMMEKLETLIGDEGMQIINTNTKIEKSNMKTMLGSLFIYS